MATGSIGSALNYEGLKKTDKGTKIVQAGDDLDKNSFLTILAAELSNQDPTQDIDSTQYVTQLAQFTSLEQMSNLNNTMTNYANQSLVGKGVTVSQLDSSGKNYTGIVYSINKSGSQTTMTMLVNENNENIYKTFNVDDVISVVNVDDYSIGPLTNINGATQFLLASSFMDKNVELADKDENGNALTGRVIGVVKDNGQVKVRVELSSTGEIKEYGYDSVVKVGDFTDSSTNSTEK